MANEGTHRTHCCIRHGCKYGYDHYGNVPCPVTSGKLEQEYHCEDCYYENGAWNPIRTAEDLPKKEGFYYVTMEKKVFRSYFDTEHRIKFWLELFDAWMELPQPPAPYTEL
jgi:hypothetical protein